ncbi:DNA-binding domain-containing protein [Hoeflea sp. YIM 152468]|uniref:HvfC/BufC N-terminal domain-containing protein n=1 Tax=Hoeflea sp. YIM 152468 TaxID=3031759 RepID=UPI0023DA68F1|nr:DNA-binding domain-containing protein [Hoeflea sp. YIM 152468]MDF1607879.1 DNA-binding domain-containing protein [Hoeflea sp. YIM 152468]
MPQGKVEPPSPQAGFGAALLNPDLPLPDGVIGPGGKAATKRFAVYRNNVTVSLINALADIFPAVQRLVGEGFFRDMARIYLAEEPPQSALMFEYGAGFAAFLERFKPVDKLPYLPDVARMERAWLDAYHASDAEPLRPESLGAISPENLGETIFTPHPATCIVQSRFAVVSIFSASREQRPLGNIRPLEPEDGLITRPSDAVQVRTLPSGASLFFEGLIAGATLSQAASITLEQHSGFDLPSAISAMLEAGLFSSCTPGQTVSEPVK